MNLYKEHANKGRHVTKIFFVNVVRQLFYMHIRDDDEQIGKKII